MPAAHITDLFPTPFLHKRKHLGATRVEELLEEANRGRKETNHKSSRLAHTAPTGPDARALTERTSGVLLPSIAEFGALLFGESLRWTLKEAWFNALDPGGHQALHSHANSFVSGIVYLTPSHPSSRTVFYRGLGGRDFTFSNDHAGSSPGPYNSPKWAVPEVAPGDLVLFPSFLLHEVPTNQGERRVTLSFNAVPERLKSWGYEIQFSAASSSPPHDERQ